jgi:hypothetical protein
VIDPQKRASIEVVQNHPWVNEDEESPPTILTPPITSIEDKDLGKVIKSIHNEKEFVVYSFNALNSVTSDPIKSAKDNSLEKVNGRRRSHSISSRRTGTWTPTQEIMPDIPQIQIQVEQSIRTSAVENVAQDTGLNTLMALPVNVGMRRRSHTVTEHRANPSNSDVHDTVSGGNKYEEDTNKSPTHEEHTRASAVVRRISSVFQEDEFEFSSIKINTEEINNWHEINRPAKSIRTIKFNFNPSAMSATLEPAIMFQDLHRALSECQAEFEEYQLTFKRDVDYYLFDCHCEDSRGEKMNFTIELCKVWLLQVHALKIRKRNGSSLFLKEMHDKILQYLHWKE